ncbi:MAG: hypothetical protein HY897_04405 [Deltaproteobacteria bacterium]|nr:hypothetical protein [Deltaproteobacteria bacterium]
MRSTLTQAAARSFCTLAACVALAACVDIPKDEAAQLGVTSMFDTVAGVIPLPNDVLKNPATGKLYLPPSDADSPLTLEVKDSLSRLDGWLTSMTITIPFDGEIDPASLGPETVQLYDVDTAAGKATKVDSSTYYVLFDVGLTPAKEKPYYLTVKTKPDPNDPLPLKLPKEFIPGHTYAAMITNGLKGADGNAVTENPVFDFLRSKDPLADSRGRSLTVLPDADAALLELARSALYNPAFAALEGAGVVRSDAVSFTAFSIQSGARAVFNPTLIGRRLPQPIDDPPGSPAKAPLDAKPSVYFDQAVDPSTVKAGVRMYKWTRDVGTNELDIAVEAASAPDDTGLYKLTITPPALEPSQEYLVVTTEAILTLVTRVPTAALAYFSICRYQNSLIDPPIVPADFDRTRVKLNSPFLDSTLDVLISLGGDPTAADEQTWKSAYGFLIVNLEGLEKLRQGYAPLFDATVKAGTPRAEITALWSFTTAAE